MARSTAGTGKKSPDGRTVAGAYRIPGLLLLKVEDELINELIFIF